MEGKTNLRKQGSDSSVEPIITAPGETESDSEERPTLWLALAVFTTLLGASIPAGYCLGVINTPQEIIRSWIKLAILECYGVEITNTQELTLWAVIVSIFVVGAILGASCGAGVADRVGRKVGLLFNHILMFSSAMLFMGCKMTGSVEMLILGRLLSGICSGFTTSLVPLYLSELAPFALKGVMGITFPLGMCMGVLLSQVLGMGSILGTEENWPYLLGGYAILVSGAILLHPALPESPVYCYMCGDDDRGFKELQRLRGGNEKSIESEASSIKALVSAVDGTTGDKWNTARVMKSREFRMPLLITMISNIGQQFSGINAVFYYSTLIFRSAGLNIQQSQGASIGSGVINLVMAISAAPIIKFCRRRVIILTSAILSIVCQAVLMVAFRLIPSSQYASYVAIGAVMMYVLAYGIGLGPVPYMIATELFPAGPRSVGISVGGTSNWLSNLIVGLTFPLVQEALGVFSFTLFIVSSCFLCIFMYKCLPETYGKDIFSATNIIKEEGTSNNTHKAPGDFV